MLSFLSQTSSDVMHEIKLKFKKQRRTLSYTQKELANRSGVSLASLKRFESSGQISLDSLLKLAFILECLEDFGGLCLEKKEMPKSMDEVLNNE